jgi:hypothetical protein
MRNPTKNPAKLMVHCIEMETHPEVYAIEPQTTNVPAETKPIKRESELIHHGTAPPAAKKDFMSFPDVLEKERPIMNIKREKARITR